MIHPYLIELIVISMLPLAANKPTRNGFTIPNLSYTVIPSKMEGTLGADGRN